MEPTQASNIPECTTANTDVGYAETNETSNAIVHTSVEEFWQNKALGVSSGIDDLGAIQPHIAICWFITCVVVFLCVVKGIKSLGKVAFMFAVDH
ncbi:sodium- and chloride-dependent betaine transporter-like [Haliotis rubra]|uniref:sodium- and chloride-dependent betaine transporter-like n=1 Tax=Haliotis rubra TaxID=36100 RepID=UPI001EE59ABE|nr:sodium- and chloride-dependent betaine transporter-like [Haliotis rubra]